MLQTVKSELNLVALFSFLAGRMHTSSVRGVILLCFLHLTGWTVDRKRTSIHPASRRAACLSCVTTSSPCMLCPTNSFTSSPSSTPCDRRQRSRILFWNYFNLTSTEKVQSCKYIQILADPFSILPKPFMWVDLLFGNYLIMLKAPPPSTTSLKESSVKNKKNKK